MRLPAPLLAGPAVAGLLFFLPAGHANAQDNRDNWGWGAAGGVVLSFIAIAAAGGAAGGSSITSWLLLQRKGKRDDAVDKKLQNVLNGVNGLTSTLKSKMNLGSVTNTVEMVEGEIGKKEDNQIDLRTSNSDQAIEIYNNQPRSIIIDTNAAIDGRIFTLLESDLLEELRGRIIIAECMTDELKTLEPELRGNGFTNIGSFQGRSRIDLNNNYESKITDARLLQLTSDTDDKELFQDISNTDKKLFLLTSDTNGILITADLKLVKCCRNKNVRVLNLNELNKVTNKPPEIEPPMALKKGDKVDVKLEKSDQDPNDAITRSCGPIIVVKNAAEFVGQTKRAVITGFSKNGHTPFAKLSSASVESPGAEGEESLKPSPAP